MLFQYDTTKLQHLDKLMLKSDAKLAFFHAQRQRVEYVFNTSALEGNAMTFPEVQTLLDGGLQSVDIF